MSDTIGRITIPALVDSGLTFPLTTDFPFGFTQDRPVVMHQFGELDAKAEQRFAVGVGPRKFSFRRQHLSMGARNSLVSFWESLAGAWKSFTYNVPNPDQTTTPTKVTWEYAPLSIQYLANACQTGFNFIEVPDPTAAPTYAVASTCVRFPSSGLQTALLSQVQQIIPLIHIRVRESAVPDIYLSDRRCTVGGQLYLPRVLGLGEPGSSVILTQDIKGTADSVRFTFGNADRAMTALANDTDLKYAAIDLSLYHVNSGILIQLWAGFIITFTSDGSPQFSVQSSDGLYQITQQYPGRAISRTCWKLYNDGVACPFATSGSLQTGTSTSGTPFAAEAGSCDYYFDSANGCEAHGMSKYFGGHPAEPQGVVIKDNSTGLWGIGRSTVTATSIISDTVWGNALQEIWCNDDGDPGKAFWVNCMIAAGRDESDYYDALGIVGAGPIGEYTGMLVYQNADGYRYIIAPMLDGQTPQGFQVNGALTVTRNEPSMGLREVAGNDPVNPTTDSFSLGNGTPQVWGPQMAAGTAFVEIRRTDAAGIQPTTTDQHQMQVPISQGLTGWTWDQSGNRSAVAGLTNPFWIAVNSFLRCLGLFNADSTTQLAPFLLSSLIVGDGSGAAEIADSSVMPIVGTGTENQFRFQGVLAQQKPFRDWLTEIVACGLGYYTWEFGKLKLGVRINASAVEAFTKGNILFQSLRLEPVEAAFEHLIIDFADQAYQYQANTADYQDKSHAAYYGRSGSPLTARQHSVGCGTLSQALRLAAVRTREEIGGVTPTEWRKARNAYWKTTILALNTEVGQVVSMSHPDVPGYRGTCNMSGTTATWVSGDAFDSSLLNKEIVINGVQVVVSACAVSCDEAMWWQGSPAYTHSVTIGSNVYSVAEGTLTAAQIAANIAAQINASDPVCSATTTGVSGNHIIVSLRYGQVGPVTVSSTDGSATVTLAGTLTLASAPGNGTGLTFQIITGDFRIQSWRLNKDWSIDIAAKTVTPSMYDLTVGPKPADVVPSPLPGMFYAIPFGPAWAPYEVQAQSWDGLFPCEWNFDSNQTYTTLADGSALATLAVTGKLPVNQFSPGVGAPVIGSIAQSTTGGGLPGGITVRISLCATDANGLPSAPAFIAIVQTAVGTNTNQIVLNGITWPAIAGLASYALFASTQDDLICEQQTGTLTADGTGIVYAPASITINGPLARSTWALPSSYVAKIRIKAKRAIHSGVIGTEVTGLTAPNLVVCSALIDSHSTPFNPVGRILSVIGRPESATPFLSVAITAFDATTGTFTVSPQAVVSGHPEQSFQVGDVVVIRNLADAANTSSQTQITDSGYQNVANGYGGMTPGVEVGNILRVIQGTGRGGLRKITGNTATQLSWDLPLLLDTTSVWIVEAPAWDYIADSTAMGNADPLHAVTLNIPTDNFIDQPLVIAGFTVDINGSESPDGDCPIREDWIYGAEGQRSAGFTLPVSGTLGIQADAAPAFYLNADFVAGSVKAYVKSAPVGADLSFTIYAGSTAWLSLTIPAGSTSVVATQSQIAALATIPANVNVRLAITAVGTTFPGSDLSVFVYS